MDLDNGGEGHNYGDRFEYDDNGGDHLSSFQEQNRIYRDRNQDGDRSETDEIYQDQEVIRITSQTILL